MTNAQTQWEFTADFDTDVAPPETIKPTTRNASPFVPMFFGPALSVALAGNKPHKFVAKAFFLERTDKPELVTGSYMKSKARDQFNKWLKTQPETIRGGLKLLIVERTGAEAEFKEKGAGISIWLTYTAPPAQPTAP